MTGKLGEGITIMRRALGYLAVAVACTGLAMLTAGIAGHMAYVVMP